MKKIKRLFLVTLILAVVILAMLFFVGYFNPRESGISIDSSPASSIYLNGALVGQTPYETVRKPGEVIVKLVPNGIDTFYGEDRFYETKINLSAGVKTIVKRNFGTDQTLDNGETVSFQKTGGDASIAIISIPDTLSISIDGNQVGFTPYNNSSITPGVHQVTLSKDGFDQKTFNIQAYTGYKLTALVQLSKSTDQANTPTQTPVPAPVVYKVEILKTPNGFLRVRQTHDLNSPEVAKVKPGEEYPYVDQDSTGTWFEITYSEGNNGWISSAYAKKIAQ